MEIAIATGNRPSDKIREYEMKLARARKLYGAARTVRNIISIICAFPLIAAARYRMPACLGAAAIIAAAALAANTASRWLSGKIFDLERDLKFEEDNKAKERERKLRGSSRTLQALKALESEISTEYFKPGTVAGIMLRAKTFESYWAMEKYVQAIDRHVRDIILDEKAHFEKAMSRYDLEQAQKREIKDKLRKILSESSESYADKEYERTYENLRSELTRKIKSAAGCGESDSERPMLIMRCVCRTGGDIYEAYKNYGARDIKNMLAGIKKTP